MTNAQRTQDVKTGRLTRPRPSFFRFLTWMVIGVFLVLTLVPFAWLILSSLKTNQELFSKPFSLPARWLLTNYTSAFAAHPLTIYLRNSAVAAVTSTLARRSCTPITPSNAGSRIKTRTIAFPSAPFTNCPSGAANALPVACLARWTM